MFRIQVTSSMPSHHAISFTSTSSPFTPKYPIQSRSDLRDRHHLSPTPVAEVHLRFLPLR
uniref:Uncharacterized protein n=1 Tax=Oryza rufipogon TaxID=4529 RepID=A0A0E0Q3X4_ORYRU